MQLNRYLLLFLFLPAAIFMPPADSLSAGDNGVNNDPKILASGEGFVITSRDVDRLRNFLEENTPLRTTQEQYVRYALQSKLFAREALQKGLAGEEWKEYEPVKPEELLIFSDVYIEYIMDSYELDEAVIESYYHAFPERFLKDPDCEEVQERLREHGFLPGEWIRPLDEVRLDIRRLILQNKQRQVRELAFKELKDRYDALIH